MSKVAIMRQCQRCKEWRSIECFVSLGKLCERCIDTARKHYRTGYNVVARGLVVTDKGREALGLPAKINAA